MKENIRPGEEFPDIELPSRSLEARDELAVLGEEPSA